MNVVTFASVDACSDLQLVFVGVAMYSLNTIRVILFLEGGAVMKLLCACVFSKMNIDLKWCLLSAFAVYICDLEVTNSHVSVILEYLASLLFPLSLSGIWDPLIQ